MKLAAVPAASMGGMVPLLIGLLGSSAMGEAGGRVGEQVGSLGGKEWGERGRQMGEALGQIAVPGEKEPLLAGLAGRYEPFRLKRPEVELPPQEDLVAQMRQALARRPAAETLSRPAATQPLPDFARPSPADTPQVYYHGTDTDFVDYKKSPTASRSGEGYYFTHEPLVASQYATQRHRSHRQALAPNVRPVYLRFQKPFTVTGAPASPELVSSLLTVAQAHPRYQAVIPVLEHAAAHPTRTDRLHVRMAKELPQVNQFLADAGYDAVQYGMETVVFDNKQIIPLFAGTKEK